MLWALERRVVPGSDRTPMITGSDRLVGKQVIVSRSRVMLDGHGRGTNSTFSCDIPTQHPVLWRRCTAKPERDFRFRVKATAGPTHLPLAWFPPDPDGRVLPRVPTRGGVASCRAARHAH